MQKGVVQIADVANGIIDPVLARRAGISTALLGSWEDIAGSDFSRHTRPEKISWPRNAEHETRSGGVQPAVLTIACDGARALFVSHALSEMIARINAYFGYPAIGQIRIVQKPVAQPPPRRPRPRALSAEEERLLSGQLSEIENETLKAALDRLGRAVKGSKGRRPG